MTFESDGLRLDERDNLLYLTACAEEKGFAQLVEDYTQRRIRLDRIAKQAFEEAQEAFEEINRSTRRSREELQKARRLRWGS